MTSYVVLELTQTSKCLLINIYKRRVQIFNEVTTMLYWANLGNLPGAMTNTRGNEFSWQLQGSPLPTLLDDDTATLIDVGVGNESTVLVDEES